MNPIRFDRASMTLHLLDQRALPLEERDFPCRSVADAITAIQCLAVRGAPAIGIAGAWACCLACKDRLEDGNWREGLKADLSALAHCRPTAVNLQWAVQEMTNIQRKGEFATARHLLTAWLEKAETMQKEDVSANRAMGKLGQELIRDGWTIMTHCNAGALATAGYGTALGVFRAAREAGKTLRIIANETRPVLQGARLTAYELCKEEFDVTVACDNAAGLLMARGMVDAVIVGADRIAANGDVANKIGTYTVAILAREHGIPFYVAAPVSTIDPSCADGSAIAIEERDSEEVAVVAGSRTVPPGVRCLNFAFDLTPARLVAGIITEKAVLRPDYRQSIAAVLA